MNKNKKTYYITPQLVYVAIENGVTYSNGGDCMSFRAHVYTNALNADPRANELCYIKIKDDVWVTLPTTTPSITF